MEGTINTNNRKLNNLINGPRNFTGEFKNNKGEIMTSGAQVEASAKFWLRQFEVAFKAQFMDEDIEKYWNKLDNLKQQQDETVEQVSTRFRALLNLVGDKDIPEREKVRRYLHTIHSNIARDIVKKEGKPSLLSAAILTAKQVESANLEFSNGNLYNNKVMESSTKINSEETESDNASVHSQLSVIGELTKEIEQLKICIVEMQQHRQGNNSNNGTLRPNNCTS
ncbi:hypothetical protein INT46_005609 [Mucor plumbeus]|uniref:Retrotransposon gag domain-containing protein n=1 Tax=Mucor plumbeus TaxID=97098 RepID=A0A8H7QHF0_9FUNG|nr:hypothetical protein INT46_005609 [Mucor plumbeus]